MTRKFVALAAAALLSVVASSTLAGDDDPALKAAAESYIQHPVTQQTIDSLWSIDTVRSALVAQSRAQGTELRSDQVEALTRILKEELDRLRPQFETLMTNAVIETYSLEEIQALNEFLDTNVGASAMMKSGTMMRTFNAGAAPLFQQFFERLGARIKAELPE